jgi:hypothetical protein
MNDWQKGLTINGQFFDYKDLISHCSDKIVSAHIHPWEKEIFRFIINWLSNTDHIIQLSSGTTGQILYVDCGCHAVYASTEEMAIMANSCQ